jgi:hypothetical protein
MPPQLFAVDISDDLLDAGVAALAECDRPEVEAAYIQHPNQTMDDCCNYLVVSPVQFYSSQQGAQLSEVSFDASACIDGFDVFRLDLTLFRPCQATLGSSRGDIFPRREEIDTDARELLLDAQALWLGILRRIESHELFEGPCSEVRYTPMTPVSTQGGCAGWTWTFILSY